ncbi:MAG: hypothetical protein ACYC0C_07990 [Devosia sp.]
MSAARQICKAFTAAWPRRRTADRDRGGAVGLDRAERSAAPRYLGPELNLSLVEQPNWEIFWRLQHRLGGYGWIANIDGSNAVTGGFRYKF